MLRSKREAQDIAAEQFYNALVAVVVAQKSVEQAQEILRQKKLQVENRIEELNQSMNGIELDYRNVFEFAGDTYIFEPDFEDYTDHTIEKVQVIR